MIHLITGGSASGKSAYAEQQAMNGKGARFYIATMEVYGEEGHQRVARHRAMREGKGFVTIECCLHLDRLKLPRQAGNGKPETEDGGQEPEALPNVLLECMTNLVANEQFSAGGSDAEILQRILDGIQNLHSQADNLIVVTQDVGCDGVVYEEEVRRYQYLLGCVNRQLAKMADVVTEVVFGIPVCIKKPEQVSWQKG